MDIKLNSCNESKTLEKWDTFRMYWYNIKLENSFKMFYVIDCMSKSASLLTHTVAYVLFAGDHKNVQGHQQAVLLGI